MKRTLAVGFMVVLVATGIFLVKAGKAVAEQELIVSAAASLTNAFQEIGEKFSSTNP